MVYLTKLALFCILQLISCFALLLQMKFSGWLSIAKRKVTLDIHPVVHHFADLSSLRVFSCVSSSRTKIISHTHNNFLLSLVTPPIAHWSLTALVRTSKSIIKMTIQYWKDSSLWVSWVQETRISTLIWHWVQVQCRYLSNHAASSSPFLLFQLGIDAERYEVLFPHGLHW